MPIGKILPRLPDSHKLQEWFLASVMEESWQVSCHKLVHTDRFHSIFHHRNWRAKCSV